VNLDKFPPMIVSTHGVIIKLSFTLEKLDIVLIIREYEYFFPLARAIKIVREISHHNPIIIDTRTMQQ
jgi:hypothetical protein